MLTFGPLDGLVCICFLSHLLDLPRTPAFVTESPVLDLFTVSDTLISHRPTAQLNLHYRAPRDHSFCAGWHSMCCRFHCSTQPSPELRGIESVFAKPKLFAVVHTLIQGTGAKVEAKVGLSPHSLTPLHELIGSELVGLGSKPSKLRSSSCQQHSRKHGIGDIPGWSLILGANTVEPVVSRAEVTAGIPNDGDVEPLQRLQNIRAEAILIG